MSAKHRVAVIATPDTPVAVLARELGLPLADESGAVVFDYLLARTPQRLELRDNRSPRARPIYVDVSFVRGRQSRKKLSRRQPLARALGARTQSVVDATAGLGQDALLLACMGYRVMAIERSPLIAALLRDGVARANRDNRSGASLASRLTVITGDARELVPTIFPRPDVVYMDPMFPPKRRSSALAKKSVRVLRDLVGDDEDALELFLVCRQHAANRVVIKRPDHATPLFANPTSSYEGKLVRYDVYSTRH